MNYLRPDIKRGNITPEEDDLIIRLHALLGNRWSLIAGRLPGRTDNEIKNYWNTHLSKKLRSQGTDPNTHKKLSESELEKLAKNCNRKRCKHTKRCMKTRKLEGDEVIVDRITKIHLPKPVRVKPVISMTRNYSNTSLETNNLSLHTTSASYRLSTDESEDNIILNMPSWLDNNVSLETNNGVDDDDHLMMMTIGSSSGRDQDEVVTVQDNNNQQLEKLYEEYLQLIKVDHDHDHDHYHDGDVDDGEAELDSFTESFLI